MKILNRIKHAIGDFYLLYADSTEVLENAKKIIRPLPQGCEMVKLTKEIKNRYKYKNTWKIDQMLQVGGGVAWAIVNDNNEIIAYHYGTCRGRSSLFFKVKNCDYEHIEVLVDERFRRKGLAVCLLYHAIKNLDLEVSHKLIGTCIRPYNIPSLKLHQLLGFKKTRRVFFIHKTMIKDGQYSYLNIPCHSI